MSSDTAQTTRFLAASAILQGSKFRRGVLEYLDDPNRGVVPEVGVDLPLLVGVCQQAEKRERRYELGYAALATLMLILLAAGLMPAVGLLVIAAATMWFKKREHEREAVLQDFRRDGFDPATVARRYPVASEGIRLDAVPTEGQNLIVYSGFSPFVGAGSDWGGWSFSVAIDKPANHFGANDQVTPFSLGELYSGIVTKIERLELPDVDARPWFFVNGSDIRHDRVILPNIYGRPTQALDQESGRIYLHSSDPRVRSYVWLTTKDWWGEVVMSYFLRFSKRGPTLFVEIQKFLLTPLAPELRKVDNMGPERLGEKVALALTVAPVAGLVQAVAAPFVLLGHASAALRRGWRRGDLNRRRLIDGNPLFNYGCGSSIRSNAASGSFTHYFQRSDRDLFDKTLDREILDSLVTFLDDHNVDTTDLRERQSTILNNGVMVHGGNVQAESLAVGSGAQATKATVGNMVRRAISKPKGTTATGPS